MTKLEVNDPKSQQDKSNDAVVKRCMICARPGDFEGGICDTCKAKIKGEAT